MARVTDLPEPSAPREHKSSPVGLHPVDGVTDSGAPLNVSVRYSFAMLLEPLFVIVTVNWTAADGLTVAQKPDPLAHGELAGVATTCMTQPGTFAKVEAGTRTALRSNAARNATPLRWTIRITDGALQEPRGDAARYDLWLREYGRKYRTGASQV